jgi:hypothetical protein
MAAAAAAYDSELCALSKQQQQLRDSSGCAFSKHLQL